MQFYDQISALHKSVRGSDPDAALYWLCRMLDGGADPLYIARRAAPDGVRGHRPRRSARLTLALDAVRPTSGWAARGELALAQAVIYLACAAKSNAVYAAYGAARVHRRESRSRPVPLHLRNAPTRS